MKIQALLRRFVVVPAACSLFLAASLGQATTLTPGGFANGSEDFTLTVSFPIAENPVPAGGFVGTFGTDAITFWCAELTQTFSFGNPYDYTASALNNINLKRLFAEVGASTRVSSTLNSAAFQLDVWEILFEGTTTSPYDLTTGNFQASGDANTLLQANAWLLGLGTGTPANSLFLLSNPDHQDFITDSPPVTKFLVPEPASLPLLGIGLVAVMFAARRRTQRADR